MEPPRLRDVRDGALLVEHPSMGDDEANRAIVALGRSLLDSRPPGLLDAIPGARTLLLLFEPETLARERLVSAVERAWLPGEAGDAWSRLRRIPAVYDGEDLSEVARFAGIAPQEVARRHAAAPYRVAFVGFAPGFGYLSGLPPELAMPRRPSPRLRVPAGSVAIGAAWTGVYPAPSPGGWHLIGRTSVRLFDPRSDPPALLRPGDRVRFEGVDPLQLPAPEPEDAEEPAGQPVFRVLSPGLFTSVQGAPRFGLGSSGVPAGGAMDLESLEAANALVGNAPGAGALEVTLAGPELECLQAAIVAIAGAGLEAAVDGGAAPIGEPFEAAAGRRLRCGRITGGARAYLAARGGLAGPRRRLTAGDEITPGPQSSALGRAARPERVELSEPILLRVLTGPEADGFPAGELQRFFSSAWRVTAESDRRGLRLEGRPLAHAGQAEIAPSGTVPGSVQVPGSGLPILLGPDGPVTGGYPRIATVIGADLGLLGQTRPGAVVRFAPVSLAEALLARSRMRLP